MPGSVPEVSAARGMTEELAAALQASPAFQALAPDARAALVRDLSRLRGALGDRTDPYALTLETPAGLRRRFGDPPAAGPAAPPAAGGIPAAPRAQATETLAARAG